MAVSSTTRTAGPFVGTGADASLPFGFKAFAAADLLVSRDGTELTEGIDYTVTLNADQDASPGGSVEIDAAANTLDSEVWVESAMTAEQQTRLTNLGGYYPTVIERALDRVVMLVQQLMSSVARGGLNASTPRAGKFLAFDADGNLAPSEGTGADDGLRDDLAAASGSALAGFAQAGSGSASQSVQAKLRNSSVHLMDKIPVTEWAAIEAGTSTYDASTALALALTLGKRVILPSGTVLANVADLPSGTEIEGECRGASILRPFDRDGHMLIADSGAAGSFVEDLRFANFTAYGWVEAEAFFEQCHLFFLNGVKRALFQDLTIKGFRGDGLCFGSGLNTPGITERHNHAVMIANCEIDGINKNNRNGISVLDCDGFTLRDSTIRNTSRNGNPAYVAPADYDETDPGQGPGMPGPIDFEPDGNAFHLIRGVLIDNVRFHDNGGNIGEIAFPIPAAVTTPVRNVTIRNVKSWNYGGTGYDIYHDIVGGLAAPSVDQAFRVENYTGRTGNSPFWIDRCRGVYISGSWSDYASHSLIGFEPTTTAVDVTCDVRFKSVGDAAGFWFGNVDGLTLSGKFDACAGDAAGKYPIMASALRTSSRIVLDGVEVIKRASQTIGIVNQSGTHTFTPATNRQRNVTMTGLTSDFTATAPGETFKVSFTWDPANLADGAGETKTPIAVTGLAFGDTVSVQAPYDLQDHTVTAYVQAAGVAEARLQNESGGAVDLASGTWTLTVRKALA